MVLPAVQNLPLPAFTAAALWGVEVVLYALFAGLWSRQALLTVLGIGLGVATRLAANLLIFLLLRVELGTLFKTDNTYWLFHLWSIVLTGLIFLLAYKALIEDLCAILVPTATTATASKKFAFNDKAAAPAAEATAPPLPTAKPVKHVAPSATMTPIFVTDTKKSEEKVSTLLAPPEGFVPVTPLAGVTGTISLPAKVVLDSVPEAKNLLLANSTVHVPMSYLLPQLPRGTAWLTWQQVFERGLGVTEQGEARKDTEYQGRWVRIPPKYFVPQLAQSYFTAKKTPPRWMSLPEVPQEAEIRFE